jgi:hypothetical protein
MVIQTAALSAANRLRASGSLGAPLLAMFLVIPLGLRRRTWVRLSCWTAVIVVAGGLQGCGSGGYALPQSSTPVSHSQTYTVTVSGTSGSTVHSVNVQIIVQGS